jgi:DNA-binding transcriptional ArsR family regulator
MFVKPTASRAQHYYLNPVHFYREYPFSICKIRGTIFNICYIEYSTRYKLMDGYRQTAEMMKALGHPTRLQILEVLSEEGESCVCHLENRLGQRQAYISQQLARLREADIVVDRREGLFIFYALRDNALGNLLNVARETAIALAGTEGRRPHFREFTEDLSTPCICPNCADSA